MICSRLPLEGDVHGGLRPPYFVKRTPTQRVGYAVARSAKGGRVGGGARRRRFTRFRCAAISGIYKPQPLRPLEAIRVDIIALEKETEGLLARVVGTTAG